MTKNSIAFSAGILMLLSACGEDNVNNPRGSQEVPKQVTIRGDVKNVSGASIIYFDLPADNNLKYVKAVWTTDDKQEYTQSISRYTDSVVVDGFREAGTYTVNLYSVSPGGTESKPVAVTVNPELPPYLAVYEDLEIRPTFNGIRVVGTNETGAKLAFKLSKLNSESGKWEEIGMEYLTTSKIDFTNRGHQAEVAQEFKVEVRDRWGHWSDPKEATITPWYEVTLDRTLFKEVALCNLTYDGITLPDQTDYHLPSNFWGHVMHQYSGSKSAFTALWDGETVDTGAACYHTKNNSPLPLHMTIDLGAQYSLSRMQLWPRNDASNGKFKNGHPLLLEVFGSTYNGDDPYGLTDDINDRNAWESLGEFTLRRSDGSTDAVVGTISAEDQAICTKGHDMELLSSTKKVRYIRVQVKRTYLNSPMGAVMIGELAFFGSDK